MTANRQPTECDFSRLVLERAKVLRAYKSAMSLKNILRDNEQAMRMLQQLINDLLLAFPGLDGSEKASDSARHDVKAWPIVGHRRTDDELGRTAINLYPAPMEFDVV